MITRDLTITVNNNTATLSEPVTLYRGDRGIVLSCKIMQYKFKFNRASLENVINRNTNIIAARVLVHRPTGEGCFEVPYAYVEDDTVQITITSEWLDEIVEVGTYRLQIQLYGENPYEQRVTIPAVEFTVEDVLCDIEENLGEGSRAGYAEAGISVISETGDEYSSDYPNGVYNRTQWNTGDVISSNSLNKMEDAIDHSIKELVNKADKEHTHEGMLTSNSCSRVEFVTSYPSSMDLNVLYILVRE